MERFSRGSISRRLWLRNLQEKSVLLLKKPPISDYFDRRCSWAAVITYHQVPACTFVSRVKNISWHSLSWLIKHLNIQFPWMYNSRNKRQWFHSIRSCRNPSFLTKGRRGIPSYTGRVGFYDFLVLRKFSRRFNFVWATQTKKTSLLFQMQNLR